MPLYEFLCESCGRTLEVIQSVSESPPALCDRCGGPLKKLLSAPALQFKGTGWYVSDYGKSRPEQRKGEGSPAEGGATEASTSKEASKEAPKEPSKPAHPKTDLRKGT